MKELELSVQEIKELMEAFRQSKLGSLKIRQGDFALKLEAQKQPPVVAPGAIVPASPTAAAAIPAAQEDNGPAYAGNVVFSPIVGTFYEAPGPDKEPFVHVGSNVRRGDVLFIIESMKLMNEVTSEFDGTVREILVKNVEGVEYGQPIMVIA